ncbi:MAG: RHS repeat-associated core domain-containing protein, partial [Nocardiopsaceae bacterium]|nr:RHS repeat-associated core domain-containing protein [Nocardiopsaceae bacterium]
LPAASPDGGPRGTRDVAGTLTRRAGNVRYRHDAAGRVIQRTRTRLSRKPETWRYQWDSDGRLTAATMPDGSAWLYRYDPLGRRVAKQHLSRSGEVLSETRFAWDGLLLAEQAELLAEQAGATGGDREGGPASGPGTRGPGTSGSAGARERVTTWDYQPGTFTPLAQATRTTLRDAPQEVIDEEFLSIITDLTGTPTELVSPDGAIAGHQQRTLWGNTAWHHGGASTPLRFPGQYHDPETGLHYNNQRYYDPATGAYLTPDPLGLGPAPNPHAYVPNPHAQVDPLGLAGCGDKGNPSPGEYGPFHRLTTPSQSGDIAAKQVESQELWGQSARYSNIPAAKAYNGPLPPGKSGVEFYTPVAPTDTMGGIPGLQATWYRGSPGVVDINDEWVKIPIRTTKHVP